MNEYVLNLIKESSKNTIFEDLTSLRETSRADGVPTILSDSLNELILTVAIKQPKKILELGTATGCSGIAMLETVNGATLYTVEVRENSYLQAKENFIKFGLSDRVKQYLGNAEEIIENIGEKFDFVFLDCNKSKYKDLLPKIKNVLNDGGVLFADNVLFRGYVSGEVKPPHRFNTIKNNMRTFLSILTEDKDFITTISEVGDGISISYKK